MPLLNMEVLCRRLECYPRGDTVPPARWPIFGKIRICQVAIFLEIPAHRGPNRGPNSGRCLMCVAAVGGVVAEGGGAEPARAAPGGDPRPGRAPRARARDDRKR